MPCEKIEGANVGEWTQDYEAAIKLAKEKGSTVILNFTGSDWCGWCKIMDKNVFHHVDFPPLAKELNLVLVYIDFPQNASLVPDKFKSRNKDLSTKYGVEGYPTYILFDSTMTNKLGKLGSGRDKTPASFTDEIKFVVRTTAKAIDEKAASLGSGGEAFKAAFKAIASTKKELSDWIDTKPSRTPGNEKLYNDFTKRIADAKAKFNGYF